MTMIHHAKDTTKKAFYDYSLPKHITHIQQKIVRHKKKKAMTILMIITVFNFMTQKAHL